MKRILPVVMVCCVPLFVTAAEPSPVPVLKFSVYAVVQKGSPLRIVDLKYGFDRFQLVIVNNAEKVITGADIVARITAPSGCSMAAGRTGEVGGADLKGLHINPNQTLTLGESSSPLSLSAMVFVAQRQQAAGAHVQVAVKRVVFADGTEWRPDPDPRLPTRQTEPFSPSLVDSDTGMCSSPSVVLEALEKVKGTTVRTTIKPSGSSTETIAGVGTPHIVFECSLEEELAICPKL